MARALTARAFGYRLPAEWEPQDSVWFSWPVADGLWPGRIERVRDALAGLYAVAARHQRVRILCPIGAQPDLSARLAVAGADRGRIELFDYASDDVWCRDFGPLFLINESGSELAVSDWRFNGWGGKFPATARDDAASAWIADALGLRRFAVDRILEGGAIESDGGGRLLSSEAVLLNPNRNPGLDRQGIEKALSESLGVDTVLWLGEGIAGDDTDGHVDNLARFFKADGILAAAPNGGSPATVAALEDNLERIRKFRTAAGKPYAAILLPLPDPVVVDGEARAASYLNFLVLNGAVLVPTYGQPDNDAAALEVIGDCFPGREITGVDCREIIAEGGALHCLSLHQPAAG